MGKYQLSYKHAVNLSTFVNKTKLNFHLHSYFKLITFVSIEQILI